MEYKQLVQSYLEVKTIDNRKALDIIHEMKQLGIANPTYQNRYLYYQAQLAYENGELEKSLEYAIQAIQTLADKQYSSELSKSYNLMGVIYNTKGDSMQALDCYLDALDLIEKNQDTATASGVYNNIGCIYDDLQDHKTAIVYFKKALDIIGLADKEIYTLEAINLALMYGAIDDWEMAKYYYDCAYETQEGYISKVNEIHLALIKCLIANHNGHREEVREQLNIIQLKCSKKELNTNDIYEVLNAIPKIIDICFKDEIIDIIEHLEILSTEMQLLDALIKIQEIYVAFYKLTKDKEKMLDYAFQHYETTQLKKEEHTRMLIDTTNLKMQMRVMMQEHKEMEEKTQHYQELAQHDELTGLYNRTMLKNKLEIMFNNALRLQQTIGVVIIDINDFKQYNDYYGHVKGDYVIREMARVMLRLCDEKIHFVRYGGDEFLGFFYDIDAMTIKSMIHLIHAEIRTLNISHEKSSKATKIVSATFGAYIDIPKPNDTFYDFVALADDQLYKGKRDGRAIIVNIA